MNSEKIADPGFGEKYAGSTKRLVNPDGSFNVRRRNTHFSSRDLYQRLTGIKWLSFLGLILGFYAVVNLFFTLLYLAAGFENLKGLPEGTPFARFMDVYFFSVQTFTTVGYGTISPHGIITDLISSLEAISGWLFFALATGLLYARFSQPSSRILFSKNVIVTPGDTYHRLMFRIVNQRSNAIMELEAKAILMLLEKRNGQHVRQYYALPLERANVSLFPLNWTIVHPINPESPLYGKTADDLKNLDAELLILIKGFDDTFSQVLHTRFSYRHEEIIWGARFRRAYEIDADGVTLLDMDWLHEYDEAALPEMVKPELQAQA